ncbi:MAG: ABC transporter ATP-binding protein [Actinobacteria bacterium]|nr:ABC transporter ATP-binding protein [Actinomycetota bacterium]
MTGAGVAESPALPRPGGEPMLELVEITKRFPGVLANDAISLRVDRGEILGLLGENGAGKSTLMNIVYGMQAPDSGEIRIGGEPVTIRSPQDAVALRVGMVHQHFMLVPDMTVAENVVLEPSRGPGRARLEEVGRELEEIGRRFELYVSPTAMVEDLSTGERQRVEILKVLYRDADILILDEPTSALTPQEWTEFAGFLRRMAEAGKAVIFITHKLDELFDLVDRCVVLRDGRVVDTVAIGDTDKRSLAKTMVGREVTLRAERPILAPGRPVLDVKGLRLGSGRHHEVDGISFEIREHEVFGIAGVSGNGQDELVEALVGLAQPTAGEISIDGEPLVQHAPRAFTAGGGALIPENRHADGVATELSLLDNLILKELDSSRFSRHGVLALDAAREHAEELVAAYDIRGPGVDAPIGQLSGGNQQKAVLARELSRDPRFVIAFQPTLGLDVGAMETVYRRLNERKSSGSAVLLVSYELDEILSMADRFAVMVDGRFLSVIAAADADTEVIGMLMGGEEAA